jgi:amidohydrolase
MSHTRSLLFTAIAGALLAACHSPQALGAVASPADVAARVRAVESTVIAWRRDFHEHPELANRETRTAGIVADELRRLGLEVRTGVAHTGVIGILRGAHPGRIVALRADMDALPVEEKTVLPFSSHATGEYQGHTVPVMHACGHDAHVAMLLGAARVLAAMRQQFAGTIVFVFQPAEEGAPEGEDGGAPLILAEHGLDDPAPGAIFGIHVWPGKAGTLYYRPNGAMAANDVFKIVIQGKQAHGAMPWNGIDSITTGAEIVQALNAVVARQLDMSKGATVVTVAQFQGGVRTNIMPERVELAGTIRSLDDENRAEVHRRVQLTAQRIAESAGATATVTIRAGNPVTWNDPNLTEATLPSLRRAAGEANVELAPVIMASEDFSAYQHRMPGLFYFLGVNADGVSTRDTAPNHSPYFFVNEAALATGVRAHVLTALDYLDRR